MQLFFDFSEMICREFQKHPPSIQFFFTFEYF